MFQGPSDVRITAIKLAKTLIMMVAWNGAKFPLARRAKPVRVTGCARFLAPMNVPPRDQSSAPAMVIKLAATMTRILAWSGQRFPLARPAKLVRVMVFARQLAPTIVLFPGQSNVLAPVIKLAEIMIRMPVWIGQRRLLALPAKFAAAREFVLEIVPPMIIGGATMAMFIGTTLAAIAAMFMRRALPAKLVRRASV